MDTSGVTIEKKLCISQACTNPACNASYALDEMVFACRTCGHPLEYTFDGDYVSTLGERGDLWDNFPLIPLDNEENIVSLGAGGSPVIHLEELSREVNGANVFLMCDSMKNPTGTFKDREASIILSRCKELGLDNLVFYSTANTGRAYTHYAAHLGLTTYLFMPAMCHYKNTSFINRNDNNFIIYVNEHYPKISPYARSFAKENGLTPIAPMHDRTEAYATLAYEQFRLLPQCNYFVQTIASGMGPIGFYKGHQNLTRLGVQKASNIPTIVCIQSGENNLMSRAYNSGRRSLVPGDLPTEFPDDLFEPTLNSTNPVNNYPQLLKTLDENGGIITDVDALETMRDGSSIAKALEGRRLPIRVDLEKSLLIGYAGIRKLAGQGKFKKGENILLLATGRGRDNCAELLQPDAVIDVTTQHPVELFGQLRRRN
jgi:threonine synthase